jgi:capsular exopolysaccharide synthesis family protein
MSSSKLNTQVEKPSQFLNYLQLLWFRRWAIIIITILFSVLGVIWLSGQAPVYRATSSLMIGFPESQSTDLNAGNPAAAAANINDEIEVLRSRELISTVITRFQLQVYDEFDPERAIGSHGISGWANSLKRSLFETVSSFRQGPGGELPESDELSAASNIFLEKLQIERAAQSNVVNISFLSLEPELSARIANALPEAYIAAQLQAKLDDSEAVSTWFSDQFKRLKEQLTASERAEEYYRKTLSIKDTRRHELLEQQLADLNSRIIIARAQKANAVARLSLIKSIKDDDANFEKVVNSLGDYPLIQQLLSQKVALMETAAELAVDNNAGSPELVEVDAEIAKINIAIRSAFDNAAIELQNEVAAVSRTADNLESELTQTALESGTQQRRMLQLKALEEETAINRMKFESFIDQYKGSGVTAETFIPDAKIISLANVNRTPLYPDRNRKLLIIILSGLAIAVLVVFSAQLRNPGLLSPEHVEHVLGTSTIGVIPIVPAGQAAHDLVAKDPDSDYTSAVNALKITLDLSDMDNKVKVIQLVSSVPEEGKTSLAISLAQAVATFGQKVLLVNANLRDFSIQEKLDLQLKAEGLTDLMLSNENELADYVMTGVLGGIDFLPAGTAMHANADVIFASQRMESIVNTMRAQYDFIIFDAPPVKTSTDAIVLSKHMDKTLFVLRWNKTSMKVAKAALRKLQAGDVDLAGIVLEQVNLQRYDNIAYSDYGYIYNQRH